jgi:hypothetical protein
VLTVPTYWYSIRASGALGAAATWLVLQAIAVPLYTAWVNRKYVNVKDSMGLALSTLLAPSAVSIAVNFLVARMAFPTGHRALDFAWIAVSLTITTCCCAFIMLRRQDLEYLSRPVSRRAS